MGSNFILMHVMNKTYLQNEGIWNYYQATLIAVLFLSIIGVGVILFSLYIVSTTALLHKNLLFLTYIFAFHYPISAISQGFIIVMQLRVTNTDTLCDDSLFFTMSLIRGYCLFIATYNGLAMTIERVFATIYLKNYESTNRIFIPFILGIFEILLSIFSLFLFYKVNIAEIYLLSFVLILNVFAFIIYLTCNRLDLKRYYQSIHPMDIVTYQKSRHMTLSERFQLAENIRIAKLFKLASIIVFIFNTLLLSIGLVKPLKMNMFTTHLIYAAFDLADVAYAICLPTISITYNEKMRQKSLKILSKLLGLKKVVIRKDSKIQNFTNSFGKRMMLNSENVGKINFEQLKNLWN